MYYTITMKLIGIEWDDEKTKKTNATMPVSALKMPNMFLPILKDLNAMIEAKIIHRVKKDGKLWARSGRFSLWFIRNAERINALYLHG